MADAGRAPNTTDLNPEFASRLATFRDALTKAGIQTQIASGYRSPEYQNQMYQNHLAKAAGKSLPYPNVEAPSVVAPAWSSFHNYGLAADVTPVNPNDYQRMWDMAGQFGITPLRQKDIDHFQMSGSLAANIAQYKLAGWRPESSPAPTSGAIAYSGPGGGTTIDAARTPVPGALANQEVGPENAGGGAPVASSTGPQDPRQIVFNKLTAAGLPPQAALGALWSLGGESGAGLNPRAYNASDPGGSIGYGQWQGVRRTALENLAKTNGTSWADPNTQADHIINELTNKDYSTYQPGVFDKLKAATTPEEAARIWTGGFERPAKDNSDARIKGGPQVATLDDSGNLVLGSATGGGTAPSSAPATTAAPVNQSWWSKLTSSPVDAQGNPTGDKSPLQQLTQGALSKLSSEGQTAREEAPQGSSPAMEQAMNERFAPGARNVSPMGGALLPSVPQTYGQTINSLSAPLTWNSAPPRAPQTPAAGLRGSPGSQIPGMSLTSVPAMSQGLGYGIDPNDPSLGIGYG